MTDPIGHYNPNGLSKFQFDWTCPGLRDMKRVRDVSVTEAATVFGDRASLTYRLPESNLDGDRYVTIGSSYRQRRLMVLHTDIISREDERLSLRICLEDADVTSGSVTEQVQGFSVESGVRDEYNLPEGTQGRYADAFDFFQPLFYISPWERYWFNAPVDLLQTCLWWVDLEKVRSDPASENVELTFDIARIREFHQLPKDLRFVVRFTGVSYVYVSHTVMFAADVRRTETVSWKSLEDAVDRSWMRVEETRLAGENDGTGYFIGLDGLLDGLCGDLNTVEDVTIRLLAAEIEVLRTDGIPCSLAALQNLGNEEYDARVECAQVQKDGQT